MILSIAAVLLILAITFIHSLFGLFSGLINVVCAIAAMCVAFGFAEPLNALAVQQGLSANYSLAVVFLGLFVITHLVLRLAADNLIRGNVHLPQVLDLGGGAICGLLIAMISVGMLVMAFLMLPFGGRVAMFSRYERTDSTTESGLVKFKRRSVWLKPDEFTAGLFNLLSGGSLKYGTTFADVYPSFADWVTWTGNTVQPESATSPPHDSKADGFGSHGLAVQAWWAHKGSLAAVYRSKLPTKGMREHENPFNPLNYKPEPGKQLIGVRLKLLKAAADQDYHRFRPSMLRIVGKERYSARQYMPRALGGVVPNEEDIRLVDVDNNFALPASGGETLIDAYFEVGEGFEPRFVEYRRFARAALSAKSGAEPEDRLVGPPPPETSMNRFVGPSSFMRAVVESGTGSSSELPFALSADKLRAMTGVELREGKLRSGRISGFVKELTAGGGGTVTEFALPERQGMFQLRFKAKEAASLAGQVFNFVASVTNQYLAISRRRDRYYMSGFYAVVKRDQGEYLELYVPDPVESEASRSMLDFKEITRQELRSGDAEIGLLFYVPIDEVITAVENQVGHGIIFRRPGYRIRP